MFSLASLLLVVITGGANALELSEGAPIYEEWIQEFGHDTFQYPVRIILLTTLTLLTLMNDEGLEIYINLITSQMLLGIPICNLATSNPATLLRVLMF
jgi:hypothetical protein